MYLMKKKAQIVGMAVAMLGTTLLMVAGGCSSRQRDDQAGTPAGTEEQPAAISGTVKYMDLEGGFCGIVTDDGQKLDPVNLPDAFKQDGLRVKARIETLEGQVSVRMWGTLVRIIDIQRAQ